MNDFPCVPQPVTTVLFPLLNKGVNGKGWEVGAGGGTTGQKETNALSPAGQFPWSPRAVGPRGAWGREVLVSCLRLARNPPLSGRLAPAALGLGPAEPEVQGEGAPGAQFHLGSAGFRASLAWRLS